MTMRAHQGQRAFYYDNYIVAQMLSKECESNKNTSLKQNYDTYLLLYKQILYYLKSATTPEAPERIFTMKDLNTYLQKFINAARKAY